MGATESFLHDSMSQDVILKVLLLRTHDRTERRVFDANPPNSAALWKRARDSLNDKDRAVLNKNLTSTPEQLQDDILTQIERSKGGPIKLPNGEQFFVRDLLGNISRWIKMFVEVGDTIVQYDPGHAALPWAALRALLKVRS
jgi:hypothetical protein